jgi:hypothetical protein
MLTEQVETAPVPDKVQGPPGVKVTVPVGVIAVPSEVSVTVAVQLVACPMKTVDGVQATPVVVVRRVTVTVVAALVLAV